MNVSRSVALAIPSLLVLGCDQSDHGLVPRAIEPPAESLCLNSKAHQFIIESITGDTRRDLERNKALKHFDVQIGQIRTLDVTPTYYIHVCDAGLDITINDTHVEGVVRYEIMETSFARVGLKPDMPSYRTEYDEADDRSYAVAAYQQYINWFRDNLDRGIYR